MLRCGLVTQTQWIKKNVDLKLLCLHIQDFLKEKGFDVWLDESLRKRVFSASLKNVPLPKVTVKVSGVPEDFVVSFESELKRNRLVRTLGSFLVMVGLGFFVRKELKSLEFYDELEREFWSFMDKMVSELADSVI